MFILNDGSAVKLRNLSSLKISAVVQCAANFCPPLSWCSASVGYGFPKGNEMKKWICLTVCLALGCISVPVLALPSLQLDIGGGYYNSSGNPLYNDETVVATGQNFTLYALMETSKKTSLSDTYYLSMALFPRTASPGDPGSFIFNGRTINVTTDMLYGNPGLPAHDIFQTNYLLYGFNFNPQNTVGKYNVQDSPGGFGQPGTGLYYTAFNVDTSGLGNGLSVHFDLFNSETKAPFSHDAQSGNAPIPEPATFGLMASGLAGLLGFKRLKKLNRPI